MSFEIKDTELSGFDLAGYMQPSGVIKLLDTGRFIAKWPEEIYLLGNTYTLESVVPGSTDMATGAQYQNAVYC